METVRINVSGPVHVGSNVRVIGGPWRGLTGTVAWSDLQRCGVVGVVKGHPVKARVRLDQVIQTSPQEDHRWPTTAYRDSRGTALAAP